MAQFLEISPDSLERKAHKTHKVPVLGHLTNDLFYNKVIKPLGQNVDTTRLKFDSLRQKSKKRSSIARTMCFWVTISQSFS